jgi:hypothetical protein
VSDFVVIDGLKPWDGKYPLNTEDDPLTTREWGWIKRMAGYLPGDFTVSDPETICALTVIALHRAGRVTADEAMDVYGRISDAPFGTKIRLQVDPDEGDADPPVSAGATGSNENSSGNGSPTSSERSAAHLNDTGTPASASSRSGPPTWET